MSKAIHLKDGTDIGPKECLKGIDPSLIVEEKTFNAGQTLTRLSCGTSKEGQVAFALITGVETHSAIEFEVNLDPAQRRSIRTLVMST